jgi:hypothetical protein
MLNASHRLDLALPVGTSLILSTVALLLFPGIATVACQLLAGLVLIGIFAARKVLRYAREKRANRMNESLTSRRMVVVRGDVLLLIGFAGFYAAVSGSLRRAGWPAEAVRSCAFLLLLSTLVLKPRIAARWKTRVNNSAPLPESLAVSPTSFQSAQYPEIVSKERIQ